MIGIWLLFIRDVATVCKSLTVFNQVTPNSSVCVHLLDPSHRRLEWADCPRDRADLLLQKCIIRTGLTWSSAHSRVGHTQNPVISPWPPYPLHTTTCVLVWNSQWATRAKRLLHGKIFMLNKDNQLGATDDVGWTVLTGFTIWFS